MISLEEFQEAYADTHGGQEYKEPDLSVDVEETAVAQALVDQFKATIRCFFITLGTMWRR